MNRIAGSHLHRSYPGSKEKLEYGVPDFLLKLYLIQGLEFLGDAKGSGRSSTRQRGIFVAQ